MNMDGAAFKNLISDRHWHPLGRMPKNDMFVPFTNTTNGMGGMSFKGSEGLQGQRYVERREETQHQPQTIHPTQKKKTPHHRQKQKKEPNKKQKKHKKKTKKKTPNTPSGDRGGRPACRAAVEGDRGLVGPPPFMKSGPGEACSSDDFGAGQGLPPRTTTSASKDFKAQNNPVGVGRHRQQASTPRGPIPATNRSPARDWPSGKPLLQSGHQMRRGLRDCKVGCRTAPCAGRRKGGIPAFGKLRSDGAGAALVPKLLRATAWRRATTRPATTAEGRRPVHRN